MHMQIPPAEPFADITRRAVESHTWDTPHAFIVLTWNGTEVGVRTYAAITQDNEPENYSKIMAKIGHDDFRENPTEPAYAYLLQIEGYGVSEPKDPTAEELAQFHEDRRNRTFHKRPDAQEAALAYTADVHGRLWTATVDRASGLLTENFYSHDRPAPISGGLIKSLRAVAYATGQLGHNLPGPFFMAN